MSWSIDQDAGYQPPPSVEAVYYLVLPFDNVVMHSAELQSAWTPSEFIGSLDTFISTQVTGTPMIPMDSHHALIMGWVDIDRMSRNRPYLDDAIKAAIALVA